MRKLAWFSVAFLTVALLGQTKPSKIIPAELAHARYVALGYDLGSGFLSDSVITPAQFRVLPQDREALQRVRDEVQQWKRYVITPGRNQNGSHSQRLYAEPVHSRFGGW